MGLKDQNRKSEILYPVIFPDKDDFWNSNIDNVSMLDQVKIASCITITEGIGQVNLVIFIDSGTNITDIEKVWWRIKSIRDNISKVYGDFPRKELVFHKTAFRFHADYHMSYQEIAKFLNYEILVSFCAGIQLISKDNRKGPEPVASDFKECLSSFGISDDDVGYWARMAEERIRQSIFPWALEDGPITRSMVREKVRQVKKKIENGQFRILGKPDKVHNYLNYVGLSEREALNKLWEKTFDNGEKDKNQFLKWEKLREKFNFDWAGEIMQNMTLPEDVGKIRKFFP